MTEAAAPAQSAQPATRPRRSRRFRHTVAAAVLTLQALMLSAGCGFIMMMDAFGCARSDPGYEPQGDDPLHSVPPFVFWLTACFLLWAGLTRRWLVLAAEVAFVAWCVFYLATHPNDPNWCPAA